MKGLTKGSAIALLLAAGSAVADGVIPFGEPLIEADEEHALGQRHLLPADPCRGLEQEFNTWLDRTQKYVYQSACMTAAWFDGFFGDDRYDADTAETYGRVGLSTFWDERDGFDPKFRFRARFALPSARNRADLLIGRGDEAELIEERTGSDSRGTVPTSVDRGDDDALFVGLGFSRGEARRRGLRFSVGAKVRAPPEPYAKATYRAAWELTERTLLRARPIAYWRSDEGLGSTLHLDLDQVVRPNMLLRWSNFGNVSQDEDVDGVDWGSTLSLYKGMTNRKSVIYRLLVRGETEAEETLKNYGAEMRYRQRIARRWLFVEFITSLTWPKEFRDERREANWGIGAGFEMYFGPVPDEQLY